MAFRGSVALITGAGSGMGQLSAWRLAASGVKVAALDIDEEGLARTTARAPSIKAWTCDVSQYDEVERVVKEVEAGLGPLDRIVNAAGIAPTQLLLDQPVEQIHRLMEVNYFGVVNVTKVGLPGMIERGSGDLIQYASLAGWLPSPHFGAYSATKAAVVMFSETLYHENRDSGVRFLCVCPPIVKTPLLEQVQSARVALESSRHIEPDEVLDAIEAGLERGRFFVFPGSGTKTIWRVRRFVPDLIWKRIHSIDFG